MKSVRYGLKGERYRAKTRPHISPQNSEMSCGIVSSPIRNRSERCLYAGFTQSTPSVEKWLAVWQVARRALGGSVRRARRAPRLLGEIRPPALDRKSRR